MPGSVVLDTAIGLIFVFLTASLVGTAAVEWLSKRLNMRGEYLLRGLREMLDIPPAAPSGTGEPASGSRQGLLEKQDKRDELNRLADVGEALRKGLTQTQAPAQPGPPAAVKLDDYLADIVMGHPLVAALHRPAKPGGQVKPDGSKRRGQDMYLASYLSAQTFARSLIDLLVPDGAGKTTIDELAAQVEKLPEGLPARDALLTLLRDVDNNVTQFRKDLEGWYDEQMGRVSGWYKRWAQSQLFIAGAILAILMNVDTLRIGEALYRDGPVRNAVVAQALSAQSCPSEQTPERAACLARQRTVLRDLNLPIGWNLAAARTDCRAYSQDRSCGANVVRWAPFLWSSTLHAGLGTILLTLLGWLLTAVAVAFGAPFWFDALSKLGSLRTAGRRPGENRPYNPESDRSG
ncbi:hypothetical protein AB0M20_01140 [Actinoplanes sp. NPDC051633]|uniref:hypothetical protein n=1 Tax=Actinoplanes sp. NPDC051633 TaxID=3155670 RepID=UPI00342B5F3A